MHIGQVITDYMAVREDEITVTRGDIVQLMLCDHIESMFMVYRPANNNSPAAEGLVPANIIGPHDNDSSLR